MKINIICNNGAGMLAEDYIKHSEVMKVSGSKNISKIIKINDNKKIKTLVIKN